MNKVLNSSKNAKPINAPVSTLTPAQLRARYGTPSQSIALPTGPNDREFFEAHFAPHGKLCVSYDGNPKKRGRPTHSKFFADWPEFWNCIDKLVALGHSVFVSPATFVDTATQRTGDNVDTRQNLAIDIDVHESGFKDGKGNPCHVSADAALAALDQACRTRSLPFPNMIIRSGSGLHVWWLLDRPLPRSEWLVLAEAFKNAILAIDKRFGADTSRWTDASGVLRPPGSINRKVEYGTGGLPVTLESAHPTPWAVTGVATWCASITPTAKSMAFAPQSSSIPLQSQRSVETSVLVPSSKGMPISTDRLRSALSVLAEKGLAAKHSYGGDWLNIMMALAGAAKLGEIAREDAEVLMRWFSKSDDAAYNGLDAGKESETRIVDMLANAKGDRSVGSVLKAAKDHGWTDPGELIPSLGGMPPKTKLNPENWSKIIMSGGIAQTLELVQIILATPTAKSGHLALDRKAGVLRIYADGVWHAVPTPDCPDHDGACSALERLREEAFIIARQLGIIEDDWARRWIARAYDQDLIRKGIIDESEIEPGSEVTVGTVKALAMRLGKGAAMSKAGVAQRAELRRKRMDFMSADGFRKAWKELPNQPELRKASFGKGKVDGRLAVIVALDAVLRDDGTLGAFNPGYFATYQATYEFGIPDDPVVHTAVASPAGWEPPQAAPVNYLRALRHLTGNDNAVIKHVLGLMGAKLLGRDTGQKALAFIGAPASGKSLLIKGTAHAVGSAARAIGKNILAGSQRDDTRIASLIKERPRFLTCSEFQDFSGKADWGTFKEIVGGDTINARIAYDKAGIDGRFDALLILASNGLPPMASDVMAVLRRLDIVFVPAHRQLKGAAINSGLEAAIIAEAPEIARLLVQFGVQFRADQPRPEAMKRAVDMVDTSWGPKVRQWLTENTIADPLGHAPLSALNLNFDKWCKDALGIVGEIKSDELAAQIIDQGGGLYAKGRKRAPGAPPSSNALASIVGLRIATGGFSNGMVAGAATAGVVVPIQSTGTPVP